MANRFMQPEAAPAAAAPSAPRNRFLAPQGDAQATTMLQPEQTAPDKYHARANQYLDDLEAQGKVSTGGALNTLLHGATSGIGNRLIAGGHALVGQALAHDGLSFPERMRYEVALEQEKYRRASQGAGGTIGEVVGGIINPLNKLGGGSLAGSAGAGAAIGATEGFVDSGNADGALQGGAAGLAGGAIGHGVGRALQGVANRTNPGQLQAPAPNAEAIRNQAGALYDQFEQSGGRYSRGAVQDLRLQTMRALERTGWVPGARPEVDAIINRMDRMSSGMGPSEISPRDMQNLRSAAIGLTSTPDRQLRSFGYAMSNAVDDGIDNITQHPGHMIGGNVDTNAFHEANRLYRQANKAQVLENNINRGMNQAGVTYSGGNETNKILQAIEKTHHALTKNGRTLTPDEQAAFNAVMQPSQGERALRSVGKMKLGGGAVSNFANLALTATNPYFAAVPVAGQIADMIANRTARRNAEDVGRVIRNGGVSRPQMTNLPPNALQQGADALAPRLSGPFAQLLYSAMGSPAPVRGKR